MVKSKKQKEDKNTKTTALLMGGVVLFLFTSYVMAQLQYPELVTNYIMRDYGLHESAESYMSIASAFVLLLPSGALLTLSYTLSQNYKNKTKNMLALFVLTAAVALILSLLFWQYNFYVNLSI